VNEAASDERLLAAARAGDRRSLETLLGRHQEEVYRFGMRMCRDPEDAKDVLQDTLLAMARGVRDFRGASSISTWLYTIARSFCIKKRRRSKFAPEGERSLDTEVALEGNQVAAPGRPPDEALAGKAVERAIEEAIAALDPMYREVLLLRDVEGLTAPEVAEIIGVSTDAVKSRLHRARIAVRERVAPLLAVEPEATGPQATCPDVLMMFSQHLEEEISAEQCSAMERHLEGCPRCRGTCDSLKRTLVLCRTTGASVPVPASVQESVKAALRTFLGEGR
jgi:RNA polymerase sigma-70 factor (ECF subfamily)